MLLFACASISLAQDGAQWKVGDKVEIQNNQQEWVPGRIIGSVIEERKSLYRVQLDDPNAGVVIFYGKHASDIRARGGQQLGANEPKTPNGGVRNGIIINFMPFRRSYILGFEQNFLEAVWEFQI